MSAATFLPHFYPSRIAGRDAHRLSIFHPRSDNKLLMDQYIVGSKEHRKQKSEPFGLLRNAWKSFERSFKSVVRQIFMNIHSELYNLFTHQLLTNFFFFH